MDIDVHPDRWRDLPVTSTLQDELQNHKASLPLTESRRWILESIFGLQWEIVSVRTIRSFQQSSVCSASTGGGTSAPFYQPRLFLSIASDKQISFSCHQKHTNSKDASKDNCLVTEWVLDKEKNTVSGDMEIQKWKLITFQWISLCPVSFMGLKFIMLWQKVSQVWGGNSWQEPTWQGRRRWTSMRRRETKRMYAYRPRCRS